LDPSVIFNTPHPILPIPFSPFSFPLFLPKAQTHIKLPFNNPLLESQAEASQSSNTSELPTAQPIPSAINRLQAENLGERKFTPMDVDVASRRASEVGGNGKIKIGGEGEGFCRPGDEDCG
jgi:hypothetical protein